MVGSKFFRVGSSDLYGRLLGTDYILQGGGGSILLLRLRSFNLPGAVTIGIIGASPERLALVRALLDSALAHLRLVAGLVARRTFGDIGRHRARRHLHLVAQTSARIDLIIDKTAAEALGGQLQDIAQAPGQEGHVAVDGVDVDHRVDWG